MPDGARERVREEPIRVETYSGRRISESPRRFSRHSEWHEITEVLEEKLEEHVGTRERRRRFRVRTREGREFEIVFHPGRDEWFLIRPKYSK